MNGFPRLNILLDAVISDCYNFLIKYADQNTKQSIENTMKECKLTDKLLRKSYLLCCSIYPFEPTEEDNLDIIFFYKKYIYNAYEYLIKKKEDEDAQKIATLNDFCNAYLALHGFRFDWKGVLKDNLYDFLYDKYECFSKLLAKNGISEKVKKYYEANINVLKKRIKSHKKLVVELIRKLKSDDNSFQIIDNIEEDEVEALRKEIKSLHKTMNLIKIENTIDKNELLENFTLNINFNETNLDIDKKKIEYLDNNNELLNNTIKNLSNPYNFNLWRKISNIILKNIFVILNKKNYIISQKLSKQILNELKRRQNDVKDDLALYNKKLSIYIKNLEKQENSGKNNISKIDIPRAADKIRFFNLIVILKNGEYEIKPSLSIEFLFYLKENGNKLNHFNEELLDLLLFDDINIEIRNEESIKPEEKKEEFGDNKIMEKKYQGKINFKGDEIIQMFKNPENFLKKDINLNRIFQSTLDKMDEIKSKSGFKKSEVKIVGLKDEFIKLKSKIQEIISSYENHFIEYGINYQEGNKIENEKLNEVDKENMMNYLQAKILKDKIEKKIVYYQDIINDLKNMNDFKEYGISKVDESIADDENRMKNKAEVISISNIFTMFKQDLKMKIINNNEYKNYSTVFNKNNIDDFKINDFYTFLEENLSGYSFSIIKNDVTNFNLLVEIISNFKQLKEIYNDDLDIKIE